MAWLGVFAAALLIGVVFVDAFEALILPRRVRHAFRFARLYYRSTWRVWRSAAQLFPAGRRRQGFLAVFGPLSLFGLFIAWAVGLIAGFALLHWSLDTALNFPPGSDRGFAGYFYFSGTTFFTLGYGDVVPTGPFGRALSVAEAGIGFGFLAIVVGYLPVLYQAFSRREVAISLLDARAGSPPSAGELLRRLAAARSPGSLGPLLVEWERWSAELLESHLSFPVLRFFRSQHDNQSWLGTLTTILDTSAVLIASTDSSNGYQARLTFAMARHAAVDLVLAAQIPPRSLESDRLPEADLTRVCEWLRALSLATRDEPKVAKALAELRALYEPFVNALATELLFALPPFVLEKPPVDNWQTSPGMPRSPGLNDLQAIGALEEHDR
jgi:hypothetical protein